MAEDVDESAPPGGDTAGAFDDVTLGASGQGSSASLPAGIVAGGTSVGRYMVVSRIGEGGMGVVYAAFDPELNRKVAIKLLRAFEPAGARGHVRLLREAQAMAKLAHPNVVTVYDAGEHEGRVYLAMEFVEGSTLTAWLEQRPRRWQEVVAVFEQAGRGLAAAHGRGIVHRDFKPDNVMVDGAGEAHRPPRARVMDFGLARSTDRTSPLEIVGENTPAAFVTHDNSLLGTPAYMAPEQHLRQEVGPAADQFAFAVALWEGLYGERPFDGSTVADLAAKITAGERRPPPRGRAVPGWLRRICERALDEDPQKRFATMNTLLLAVERDRNRARARKAFGIVGGLALLGLGLAGLDAYADARAVAACEGEGARIEQTWNDDVRATIRDAAARSGAGHAAATAERMLPWIDAQATAWAEAATQVCLDTGVQQRAGWDVDIRDRALWCLEDRRLELEALLRRLSEPDARAVDRSVTAAAGLSRIEPCVDREVLVRLPGPPARRREDAEAIRAKLYRAGALDVTGAYADALELARAAEVSAREVGWPPLHAAAMARVGDLLIDTGNYEDAEQVLEDAYFEAARSGATETAARAADSLGGLLGPKLARHAEAERWAGLAEVERSRLPDPRGLNEIAGLSDRADLLMARGAFDEAQEVLEELLVKAERELGDEHPTVAMVLNNLSHALQGDHDRQRELFERARAINEKVFGPDHPMVAITIHNLAHLEHELGQYDRARELYRDAITRFEQAFGPGHANTAQALNNLANVELTTGRIDEAAALYTRALDVSKSAFGPDHPRVAEILNNLGALSRRRGDNARALELYGQAVEIIERVQGVDDPGYASALSNKANVLDAMGEHEEAMTLHEQALALRRKNLGPDHIDIARSLHNLAQVASASGDRQRALALSEQALQRFEGAFGADHPSVAMALQNLAAVHATMGDVERARELFSRALAIYDDSGANPEVRAEIEQWLAANAVVVPSG